MAGKFRNSKSVSLVAFVVLFGILTPSCTEQQRAKSWGGATTMDLPPGKKLVNVTWKQENFWYLTRSMRADEEAETYTFQESSAFGVMEGTVTIKEHK